MPRRRAEQWGIAYTVIGMQEGFTWFAPSDDSEPVLVPKGPDRGNFRLDEQHRHHSLEGMRNPAKARTGRKAARDTYIKFRRLAEQLCNEVTDDDAREWVLAFANEFGTLYEPSESTSISDWRGEAAAFLDLYDVSLAYRHQRYVEFRNRVTTEDASERSRYGKRLVYQGTRRYSREFTVAHEFDLTQFQPILGGDVEQIRDFEKATSGGPSVQSLMLLSKEVNRHLIGGIAFKPSWVDKTQYRFEPVSILALVYTRLWIDTVRRRTKEEERGELEWQRQCLECGRSLEEMRRSAKFCSTAHKNAFHNRQRAGRE